MGNTVEKRKPLKRSHLCPWKQGKKTLGFIFRRKEGGNLRVGYFDSKPALNCSGKHLSDEKRFAVQHSLKKIKNSKESSDLYLNMVVWLGREFIQLEVFIQCNMCLLVENF